MNTYDAAWPLLPMVRYDQSLANTIGKWMLNAANASRFFYPAYMPDEHETIPQLAMVTKGVIAYEGMVRKSTQQQHENLAGPVAQGDGPLWVPGKNPEETQFSVYGSAHVGIFGSIIRTTEVPGILQLNLLATDFYHDKAWPTYLYYNPYSENKLVTMSIITGQNTDLYDIVSGKIIARNTSGSVQIELPAKNSVVIVCVPGGSKVVYIGNKMLVNDIVVDYNFQRKK
jgi:hypothetical protein